MATAIRAIPTLYGETALLFEREAANTEQHPGTQDYRHEAEIVTEYLKTLGQIHGYRGIPSTSKHSPHVFRLA